MMSQSARISYAVMALLLLLTARFGYFARHLFSFGRSKTLGALLYLIVVVAIGYGPYFFSSQIYLALPQIADETIPAVVNYAEKQEVELPFAILIIGLTVALSLFINAKWEVEDGADGVKDSLYSPVARQLMLRFETFYESFARVIGAQLTISIINTAVTAAFLLWNGYRYATVLIVVTFLCGLLPVVGNLISNSLIVAVGFTISPQIALIALVFLVVIHKLEYFLNSRIIGDRISNPMWLTLIGIMVEKNPWAFLA